MNYLMSCMLLLLLASAATATWYEPGSDAYPTQDASQFSDQNHGCPSALERCWDQTLGSTDCKDLQGDVDNCGSCGNCCLKPWFVCAGGRCVCRPGLTACGEFCKDLRTNRDHCGSCGTRCPPGIGCHEGRCTGWCPDGQLKCDGRCVEPLWDASNCGACRTKCPQGQLCGLGQCQVVDTPPCEHYTDQEACTAHLGPWHKPCCWSVHKNTCVDSASSSTNCGECGHVCPDGSVCKMGQCKPTNAESPSPAPETSPSPIPEASPSPTPKASPSPAPEASPSPTPEASPSPAPEASPSPAPEASPSPTPEASPSPTPEASPSPTPEASLSPAPKASPSPTPKASPSPTPEASPSPTPDASPSPIPKISPSPNPQPSPSPTPAPSHSETASGWIAKSTSCAEQGVPYGVKPDGSKCNTTAALCPSADLATHTDASAPCCRTCSDFARGNNWFWQCVLPRNAAPASYTLEMLAGQFYFMGTCEVTVTATQVTIRSCRIAPGWTATVAHFYLGEQPHDACAPGGFGAQQSFAATTGDLPGSVGRSMARSGADQPIFVMLHMGTQR